MHFHLSAETLHRPSLRCLRDLFWGSRFRQAASNSWEFPMHNLRPGTCDLRLLFPFRAHAWVIRMSKVDGLVIVELLRMLSAASAPKPLAVQRIVSPSMSSPGLCPRLAFVRSCSGNAFMSRLLYSGFTEAVLLQGLDRIRYLTAPSWRRMA